MKNATPTAVAANNPSWPRSLLSPLPLLIIFLWMSLCGVSSRADAIGSQKVLVLHSYHQGYLWTDMIQEGFSRSLAEQFPKAEIYVEYMNTKRQTADTMFPRLVDSYGHLYPNVKFDVIVASDNNALDFLLLHRERLFPGVPVVFCGINDFFKYKFDPDSNITGVREDLDLNATISIALKLHPGTEKVALITDATETGQINLGLARSVAGKFPGIAFVELNKLTAAQLSDSLKQLKDDTVVLALSFFRDQAGRTFAARESMEFIVGVSPRPVYTVWDFYMAPGALGGKLLSGRLQGESAATLASSILRGKKADSLPIVESPTAYTFDYTGLKQFSVSESQLPTGAIVTGRPETFYTRYKYQLWSGIALFTLQATLIAFLLSNMARRRRGESALREQEGLYRAVADNGQALIWMAGLDKGFYYFNQPWLAFTERTLEQESGNGWAEGVHPDDVQRCLNIYVTAFDKREAFSMIYRLRRHDGEYRWLLDDGAPRYDSAGLFAGYVGHCLDVTGHKQAEDALRESEALFRAVSESAHDAIVTADSSGKIIKWNPSAGQMFGYSESEAIGQSLTFLMPNRFRDRHAAGMSRVSAGGEPHVMGKPVELVGLRKDGSEFPLDLSLAQWHISQRHFFTGVIRDITERKKIEQKLENHKEHLEELVDLRTSELTQALEVAKVADQTKDAFLANMSHELRTPLSAVIGIASLAQGISTEPKLRDYLEKIVRSGKHLNRIINELLDLSKIAAGHMELEIISFSLRTVVAHVESVMSHRAAAKGLKLATLIDDAVPDVLLGDPTRVTQIFLNLIGNAIKFTQDGGVTIRVGLRACEESRIFLNIEFEDTGIGMRPDDLKQLFKPFSQADTSVSRKFGGTGLGLTISRRLAEMMDGDISVTSIEGSGTTFKVRLWLGLGNEADLPTADSAGDDVLPLCYQDVRILVADDQPLNREIVAALLAAVGITPGMAANGQEVLDILSEAGPDAFDLVLMDIQMPVIDGLTATRALRSRAGFETLPIIAMTAHTMTHEQELNTAAGMNGHIGKPFDNASFYRTLAKWIPRAKQKTTGATDALPATPEALVARPRIKSGASYSGESRNPEELGHSAPASPAAKGNPGCVETAGVTDILSESLSSLCGVDVAGALARFCGNEVSYRRWLTEFAATAGAVPGQMRSEIGAGQGEKAGKLAHAFKGRVGMLGMTELHGMVSALELVLHEGTPADELLSALERSIKEMRDQLARVVIPRTVGIATAEQTLERVVWNDSYSVGVPALDDQHRKLVGMINRLADCHATRGSGSSGAFHEVLSRMFDYTQVHFKAEEDYLHRIDYPQLAAQKIEHAAFVGKMAAFSLAASEGIQDEAAVHRYLKAWLLSHILESDMQYRPFVESKL